MTKYTITCKDKSGKRFVIDTNTPQHYNIWSGTLWENIYLDYDIDIHKNKYKRKRIKTY